MINEQIEEKSQGHDLLESIDDIIKEEKLTRQFLKHIRMLLIQVRENVVFVYPEWFEGIDGERFPNYIIPYDIHHNHAKIYKNFSANFMENKEMK